MNKKKLENVLVINCGSSSVKFEIYNMTDGEKVLAKGLVERIGLQEPMLTFKRADGKKQSEIIRIKDHKEALATVCAKLVDPEIGVLKSLKEVDAIGHRVLHGGSKMTASTLVTEAVKDKIRECFPLGPLHNPANLAGILACEANMPGVPNVAVFDTAFHQTMPPEYAFYAIPREIYEKYDVRKYGFHGTSHRYVTQATARFLNRDLNELNIITCHLGNGSSCAAIKHGKVMDTSMGLTPLQGLVMGTRCGDIDAAVVLYLIRQGMDVDAIDKLLNKQSGFLGVTDIHSSDMRDLIEAKEKGNPTAQLAFDMFLARLTSYIGSYFVTLQKPEAVVFTGGIGENSAYVREQVIARLGVLGCVLDSEKNKVTGKACLISTNDSPLKAIVMPTNEELMIARDTVAIASE
ncbi:MAG: acetate kinase [Kiritimatiellae bacterium]|nr:acetate kinase [Kiritimatiellia bacterium]